jgi:hypothetical protein
MGLRRLPPCPWPPGKPWRGAQGTAPAALVPLSPVDVNACMLESASPPACARRHAFPPVGRPTVLVQISMLLKSGRRTVRTNPMAPCPPHGGQRRHRVGGAKEDRTPDLLRARQALSQLSYGPGFRWQNTEDGGRTTVCRCAAGRSVKAGWRSHATFPSPALRNWWAWEDLNLRPHPYQGCALTKLSYRPKARPAYGQNNECGRTGGACAFVRR